MSSNHEDLDVSVHLSVSEAVRVLITDGEQRSALALVRSLGSSGFAVFVCSIGGRSLAGASRHCREDIVAPDPLNQPAEYADAILGLSRDLQIDVIIPSTEPAMLVVLALGPALYPAIIPFAGLEAFRLACDKKRVLEAARDVGLRVPSQRVLEHADRLNGLLDQGVNFPTVVKSCRSVSEDGAGRLTKSGVSYASNPEQLFRVVSAFPDAAFPLLIQQRILGHGVGVFLLTWQGELRAVFSHRRIREKPPSGGVSVYRESIAPNPDLVERSRALLEFLGWEGVAMVEFKVESDSGTPFLIEINPRFWGSLQLAIDAGVDFPTLLVKAAMGMPVRGPEEYLIGVRSRWWWGDFDQLITHLRRGSEALDIPPGGPTRMRNLLDFLRIWTPMDRREILRFSDIRPFVRESIDWFRER